MAPFLPIGFPVPGGCRQCSRHLRHDLSSDGVPRGMPLYSNRSSHGCGQGTNLPVLPPVTG